jgi:hypothetical protein
MFAAYERRRWRALRIADHVTMPSAPAAMVAMIAAAASGPSCSQNNSPNTIKAVKYTAAVYTAESLFTSGFFHEISWVPLFPGLAGHAMTP